jgi:hypothetical protein
MQQYIDAYRNDPEFAQKGDEILQKLLIRSTTDTDFRRKLVDEPRTAFAEFTGRPESDFTGVNIRFIENNAQATIVLPAAIDTSAELSETELETVSGGSTGVEVAVAVLTLILIGMQLD